MFSIRTGFTATLAAGAAARYFVGLSGGNTVNGDAKAVWVQAHPFGFPQEVGTDIASAELVVFDHGKKLIFDPHTTISYVYQVSVRNFGPKDVSFHLDIGGFD